MRFGARIQWRNGKKLTEDGNAKAWMQIAECFGLPLWLTKFLVPSSEFTRWKIWFALKWKKFDRESYEHGLTRMFIANAFGGKLKLNDCMLQKIIREAPKDWEWMTEEEQREAIARSKKAHGFKE